MIFLFTKSNLPGSKVIRWGLNTDVSHMAVMRSITPRDTSIVLESRLLSGVDVTWLRRNLSKNQVVTALIPRYAPEARLNAVFDEMISNVGGEGYDWKGVSFIAAAAIVFMKLLKRELPPENKWADKNDSFCSEVLFGAAEWLESLNVDLKKYDSQMVTPDRARELLLESGSFVEMDFYGELANEHD